jgi:hypothetical protein
MTTKAIPSDYITTVQNLKQNSMVLAKIAAALSTHDGPPVESKFGEDWIPDLQKLKRAPTGEWREGFKDLSSESTPQSLHSPPGAGRMCGRQGAGAGAASGGRKSCCPRALLPRGPQFRLLGAAPYILGVFFTAVIYRLGSWGYVSILKFAGLVSIPHPRARPL